MIDQLDLFLAKHRIHVKVWTMCFRSLALVNLISWQIHQDGRTMLRILPLPLLSDVFLADDVFSQSCSAWRLVGKMVVSFSLQPERQQRPKPKAAATSQLAQTFAFPFSLRPLSFFFGVFQESSL